MTSSHINIYNKKSTGGTVYNRKDGKKPIKKLTNICIQHKSRVKDVLKVVTEVGLDVHKMVSST